jgi:hypothetical protein
MKHPQRRSVISLDTREAACGCISLNVVLARRFGWSEKAIERTFKVLASLSKRESALAHRNGPVHGCPCVTCDLEVPLDHLPREYRKQRESWSQRGLL